MKTRIFIALHYLELGGAEISLIGLLNAIDYSKYDVDLFLYSHRGYLMQYIPKEVRLLPEIKQYSFLEEPIGGLLRKCRFRVAIARMLAILEKKLFLLLHPSIRDEDSYFKAKWTTPLLPYIGSHPEYDCAISFLTPHNIVLDKVEAKKKIAWIHTDYSTLKWASKLVFPIWNRYDLIIAVSEDVKQSFISLLPELKEKVICIENILSSEFIRERAKEVISDAVYFEKDSSLRLLSVGRFSYQKNFENIPTICRLLIDKGLNVKWYIIGYGPMLNIIQDQIGLNKMEDHVIVLGKKTNPYPYINKCDIYVQPSRYEGKAVSVREAQMLYKPVVITNYPTSKSQIEDGVDGVIVPLDNQGCADGIYRFIIDKEKREKIIDNLQHRDYSNIGEITKLENLLND